MIDAAGKIELLDDSIRITIPKNSESEVEAKILMEKFRGNCRIKISRPYSPRSTGERSQEAHIRGHEADIALQARSAKWTPEEVHLLMKALCIKFGREYPYKKYRGVIVYGSDAEINSLQANNLIETIHQFADENGFWLHEYTEEFTPRVYKSMGGRTLLQMLKDFPEMNTELRMPCSNEFSTSESPQADEVEKSATRVEKIDPGASVEDIDSAFDGIF